MQFRKALRYVLLILVAVLVSSVFAGNEPTISAFTLSPSSPNATSNLTTTVTSTSPLGYTVYYAYNWYVDGLSTTILNAPFTNNSNVPGLQSDYDFSGNSLIVQLGNATAGDVSEPAVLDPTLCKVGTCYLFDSSNDYIQVNDSNLINFSSTQSFTISLWLKSGAGTKYLIDKGDIATSKTGWGLYFSSTTLTFKVIGTTGISTAAIANSTTTPMLNRNWHHVAAVRDAFNDKLFLYVDGVRKDTASDVSVGDLVNTRNIYIGSDYNKANVLNGSIDEVRIYNRSLSQEEIAMLYAAENAGAGNNITTRMETRQGQKWNATVIPIDQGGLNGSPTWSNTLTVSGLGDTPPAITAFSLLPSSPNATSNLTTQVTSSDADGDSVTYAYSWYTNGVSDMLLNLPVEDRIFCPAKGQLNDYSGWNFNVTPGYVSPGDPHEPTYTASGKIGSAYLFDGLDDFITLYDDAAFNFSSTQSFTISLWMKSGNGTKYLIDKGDVSGSNTGWGLYFSSSTLTFRVIGTGSGVPTASIANGTTTPMLNNSWHHIVAVRDTSSDELFLYVDGVRKDSTSDSSTGNIVNTNHVYIGSDYNNANTWNGYIDEVRIYNRSLSQQEIVALYAAENVGAANNITTLMETRLSENWNATVIPIDSYGLNGSPTWSSNTQSISGLGNGVPVVNSLTIPSPATNTTNLTSLIAMTDPDGGVPSACYNWYRNATSISLLNLPFTNNMFSPSRAATLDFSGWNFNVTPGYNGPGDPHEPTYTASGKIGSAYLFDGLDDFITVYDDASFNFSSTQSFTISLWMKSGNGTNYLIDKGDIATSKTGWGLYFASTTLTFKLKGTSTGIPSVSIANGTTTPMLNNVWHHIVAVRDAANTQLRLYVDGVNKANASDTSTGNITNTNNVYIGSDYANANTWNGYIDEVMIFNRSLSDSEILFLNGSLTGASTLLSTETGANTDQWYVIAAPLDVDGLNGTSYMSNIVTIGATPQTIEFQLLNDTMFYQPNQSLMQGNWTLFNVTLNSTINATSTVNISLYIDNALVNSSTYSISVNGTSNVSVGWQALPGNHTAVLSADPLNTHNETNETNNNASLTGVFIYNAAAIAFQMPTNNTLVLRGSDAAREDTYQMIPNTTLVSALVFDYFNSSYNISANCSFYINDTYLGYNETSSTSNNCSLTFDHAVYSATNYSIKVNYTALYVNATSGQYNLSQWINLTLYIVNATIDNDNARSGPQYMQGDVLVTNLTFYNNSNAYAPTDFSLYIGGSTGMSCPYSALPTAGNAWFVQKKSDASSNPSTGLYIMKAVLNRTHTEAVHWCLYVNGSGSNLVASSSHQDVSVVSATSTLNLSLVNGSNQSLQQGTALLYDRNGNVIVNTTLASQNLSLPGALNDGYHLVVQDNQTNILDIPSLNLTSSIVNVTVMFGNNYSSTLPTGVKNVTSIIYATDSTFFGYDGKSANITLAKNGLSVDGVYKCNAYVISTSTCSSWSLASYTNYGGNSTHIWFTVTSFSGYAGGVGYTANLTIWDDNDSIGASRIIYKNTQAQFFANYTNSTTGTEISGSGTYCEVIFNTSSWSTPVNLTYNSTGSFYAYNRSFSSAGTFAWNVTCNGSAAGHDILVATDNVTIADDATAPTVTLTYPTEGLNLSYNETISLTYTASDSLSGVDLSSCKYYLDGDATGVAIANCANTTFSTTEGSHNISVSASDNSGNRGNSSTYNFTVDLTNPTLRVQSPTEALNTSSSSVNLNYIASDGGTRLAYCNYTLDSAVYALSTCQNTTLSSLSEGAHKVNVSATDNAGRNTTSDTINFTVDLTAPAVSIQYPTEGLNLTYNESISLNFITSDATSKVNASSCRYYIDGDAAGVSITNCANTTFGTTEGRHNISVSAWDNAGNRGNSSAFNFTVDLTNPGLTVQSPTEAFNSSSNSVDFNYTASDGGTRLAYCNYTIDGTAYGSATCANTTLTLAEGAHVFNISATDNSGRRTNSSTYNFTVDLTNPGLSVQFPTEAFNSSSNAVDLNYTASDGGTKLAYCNYTLDGTVYGTSTCANVTLSSLTEGAHVVNVSATDNSGRRTNSSTYNFTVDLTNPTLSVQYPTEALNTSSSSVDLNYTASDGGTKLAYCNYTVDGTNYSLATCANTTLTLTEGLHRVNVSATDNSGRRTNSSTYNFTVDLTNPAITIEAPIALFNSSSSSVDLNYTVSDAISKVAYCNYTIDGTVYGISTCANTTLSSLSEGTHYVNVSVTDNAARSNTSSTVQFTVDLTNPGLSVQFPTEAFNSSSNAVDLNYTASDGGTKLAYCNYTIDGTVYGTSTCANVTLSSLTEGAHVVNVSATDNSGRRTNSSTYNFTVDLTNPTLSVQYPTEALNTSSSSVDLNYTTSKGGSAASYCNYTLDGTTYALSTCQNTTITSLIEGRHRVNASVTAASGRRTNSSTYNFTVDLVKPNVTIIAPQNGTTIERDFVMTIKVNATDITTNISNVTANVTRDGIDYVLLDLGFNSSSVLYESNFSVNHTGTFLILISANDTAGNINNSMNVTFLSVNASSAPAEIIRPSGGIAVKDMDNYWSYSTICPGDKIRISALEDTEVSVFYRPTISSVSFEIGSNGSWIFDSFGNGTYEIMLRKSGYRTIETTFQYSTCASELSQAAANASTSTNTSSTQSSGESDNPAQENATMIVIAENATQGIALADELSQLESELLSLEASGKDVKYAKALLSEAKIALSQGEYAKAQSLLDGINAQLKSSEGKASATAKAPTQQAVETKATPPDYSIISIVLAVVAVLVAAFFLLKMRGNKEIQEKPKKKKDKADLK